MQAFTIAVAYSRPRKTDTCQTRYGAFIRRAGRVDAVARFRHIAVVDGCSAGRTRRRSHILLTKSASWVAGSDGTHVVEAGAIDGRTVDTASRVAGLDAVAVVTVIALAIEGTAQDGVTQAGIVVAFVNHPDVCKIPRRIEGSLHHHFRC